MDARDKQIARAVAYKGVIDLIVAGKVGSRILEGIGSLKEFDQFVDDMVNVHTRIVMDEYGSDRPVQES